MEHRAESSIIVPACMKNACDEVDSKIRREGSDKLPYGCRSLILQVLWLIRGLIFFIVARAKESIDYKYLRYTQKKTTGSLEVTF